MSPVGITMMVSRRYLFITQTRTLLEIPGTVGGVDGMRRLRWNRRTIQSETSLQWVPSASRVIPGHAASAQRFERWDPSKCSTASDCDQSPQLWQTRDPHCPSGSRCSAAAMASSRNWDCAEGLGGAMMNHHKSIRVEGKYRNRAPQQSVTEMKK